MKFYELDDPTKDEAFLQGHTILCKVVLRAEESLNPEEIIIVKLSTGSKYKGKILEFNPIKVGKYTVGEALLIRVQPGIRH